MDGKEISLKSPKTTIREGIVFVPGDRQTEGLMMQDSVYQNMIMPKLAMKKQPLFTPVKKYQKEAEEVVKILSIKTDTIDQKVNNLSGGNQQKVVCRKMDSF